MTYKEDEYNIQARTNDNFRLSVNVGMDITDYTPIMKLKVSDTQIIDFSSYIDKTDSENISIDISASALAAIGDIKARYDCVLDIGSGNKEFLFGGFMTITSGVS